MPSVPKQTESSALPAPANGGDEPILIDDSTQLLALTIGYGSIALACAPIFTFLPPNRLLHAICIAVSIAHAFAAIAIAFRRFRIFTLFVAALSCLIVPIGTALGVVTFVVLSRSSVRRRYQTGNTAHDDSTAVKRPSQFINRKTGEPR